MNLDDALLAWGDRVALPEAAADDIFARIVATPVTATAATPRPARVKRRPAPVPGVDPRWWARFSAQLADTIVVGSRPAPVPIPD